MRQAGRTTRMLEHALELAGKHDVVPIMVPTLAVGETLRERLRQITDAKLSEKERKIGMEREKRIRFVSSGSQAKLRGLPELPVLADHTWHESVEWIFDAAERILDTGGPR